MSQSSEEYYGSDSDGMDEDAQSRADENEQSDVDEYENGQSDVDEEYEGGQSDVDEYGDDTDLADDEAEVVQDTGYRNLLSKLKRSHPRVEEIALTHSRHMVNDIKAIMSATPGERQAELTTTTADERRQVALRTFQKLTEVNSERTRFRDYAPLPDPENEETGKKVTLTGVRSETSQFVLGGATKAMPFGPRRGAFSRADDGVRVIEPEVKIGKRTRQYLGHLSEIFFARVKTMEVECMLVNNRILMSTNDAAAVGTLAGQMLGTLLQEAAATINADERDSHRKRQFKIAAMGQALAITDEDEELDEVQEQGAYLLAQAHASYHVDPRAREGMEQILQTVQKQVRKSLAIQGPLSIADAAAAIVDPDYKNAVIAVSPLPGGGSHAEQHLALAYIQSGHGGAASVAGTKIPCATCWLTLALTAQHLPLEFNNTPGGLWETTTFRGLAAVAGALNITDLGVLSASFELAASLFGEGVFSQYLTALEEQTHLTITIPAKQAKLKDKGLTQDTSALTDDDEELQPRNTDDDPGWTLTTNPLSPPGTYGSDDENDQMQTDNNE